MPLDQRVTNKEAAVPNAALGSRYETRWLALILLTVAAVYVAAAAYLNQYGTFWSPDSNVRFEMVRSWSSGGSPIFLRYPGQEFDPANTINPLGHVFAVDVPRGLAGIYNPVFVVACGVFYRLFGWEGLTVLPLLAGLITVVATYASARLLDLRFRLPMTLLLGIGTPLLIYSVIFWDHSLQMMLAATATFLVLRFLKERRPLLGMLAGATLGFGVWVHPLQGVLFAAMGLALILVQRKNLGRLALLSLLGFLPFVVALALWNQSTYGALGGAHAVGTLRNADPGGASSTFDPVRILQRAQMELLGVDDPSLALLLVRLYVACYLLSLFTSERLRRWAAPLFCFGAAEILWKTIGEVVWVNGLFQGAPLLLPALAAPFLRSGRGENDTASSYRQVCVRWMALTFLFFAVGVFLSPGFIGLNWGSRFLLTGISLLALLAAHALEIHFSEAQHHSRWASALLCVSLCGMSLYAQVKGFVFVSGMMQDYQRAVREIEKLDSPVLVSDSWQFSIQTLVAKRPGLRYLIAGKPEERTALFAALHSANAHEFTFVGSEYSARLLTQIGSQQTPVPFVPTKVSRNLRYLQVEFKEKR